MGQITAEVSGFPKSDFFLIFSQREIKHTIAVLLQGHSVSRARYLVLMVQPHCFLQEKNLGKKKRTAVHTEVRLLGVLCDGLFKQPSD